jgi:hypothetical protein
MLMLIRLKPAKVDDGIELVGLKKLFGDIQLNRQSNHSESIERRLGCTCKTKAFGLGSGLNGTKQANQINQYSD